VDTPKLDKIEIDLDQFEIRLFFPTDEYPLALQFNTPSRKFYFSLIALIVTEMKKRNTMGFIGIRRYEELLVSLDQKLSGKCRSNSNSNMWEKIRKAWRDANGLQDLRKGKHFKLNRVIIEEGGEAERWQEYNCSAAEADIWSNLIRYDHQLGRKWHFSFAVDTAGLALSDVTVLFQGLQGKEAWEDFLPKLPEPGAHAKIISQADDVLALNDFHATTQLDLLNDNKLKVMCWELHWNVYPLNKMTVNRTNDYIEITNSTNIHRYAKVISHELIIGDFQAQIVLKGEYTDIQLQSANGEDKNIYVTPAALGVDVTKLQKYIITRRGLDIDFRTDYGFILRYGNWNAQNDMLCYISLALNNWQTVEIHSFKLRTTNS